MDQNSIMAKTKNLAVHPKRIDHLQRRALERRLVPAWANAFSADCPGKDENKGIGPSLDT